MQVPLASSQTPAATLCSDWTRRGTELTQDPQEIQKKMYKAAKPECRSTNICIHMRLSKYSMNGYNL